jgi:murein DD-endopeptidase MepM/ murein hydrolase activator NlpD
MFMDVLAEAVTKGQGLGIGAMVARSIDPKGQAKDGKVNDGADGATSLPDLQRLFPRDGLPLEKLPPGFAPRVSAPAQVTPPSHHEHDGHDHHRASPGVTGAARTIPGVSSNYGERIHPLTGERHFHAGVDLRAGEGTAILAAAPGVVKRSGERGGYGNAIEVDHGNGLSTLYAHASELNVREGQQIAAGQEIGAVGATGRATGPHLHFEVRLNGKPIDPRRALNAYGIRAEASIEEGPNQPSKAR